MTEDLCNALPIDDLFPSLISNEVISYTDREAILAERTERRKVLYFLERYLIKGLNCSEVCDTSRLKFHRFLKVLNQYADTGVTQYGDLVKKINHWMEQFRVYSAKPGKRDHPFNFVKG